MLVSTVPTPRYCRSPNCGFLGVGSLGFCAYCEAVYHAAIALRARRLEARAARIRDAHPDLFGPMTPAVRRRMLAHLAAHASERRYRGGQLDLAALEDFFGEALDIGTEAGR